MVTMAASMVDEVSSPENYILQKHRKENKELQAEIQRLKKSVSKADKKKKRDTNVQIAQLEADLQARHDRELSDFQQVNALSTAAAELTTQDTCDSEQINGDVISTASSAEPQLKKLNKAQKRREKKAEQERDRQARIQQEELDNLTGPRHVEAQTLKAILSDRNLTIQQIPSDGNCLYAAIIDQLKRRDVQTTIGEMRRQAANQMREKADDFLPFLCWPESGCPYTQDEFEEYCRKVETSTEWGGQLEIRAISTSLRIPIEVIQATGPSIVTGEEFTTDPVKISYHRHSFGLGEHYNSVVPKIQTEDDDGDEEL